LPDGRLGGIFVADSREKGVDVIYYAKSGAVLKDLGKNLLLMNDGVVHRKSPEGDVSVVRFTSYAFDLSAFAASSDKITMFPKDRTISYLMNPDPNDYVFQEQPQSFRAELHRRFTEWLYPMVFALIALAVAGDAKSHRESRINPLITAATIALFVRWLGFFVTNQAQTSAWFTPLIYVVPLAASAISIGFIYTNRSMELPISWLDRLIAAGRRLNEGMSLLWTRMTGGGRPAGGAA
jgi:lipopolysaccharide export system permease protein